jgi:KUP system potassium uptake protein
MADSEEARQNELAAAGSPVHAAGQQSAQAVETAPEAAADPAVDPAPGSACGPVPSSDGSTATHDSGPADGGRPDDGDQPDDGGHGGGHSGGLKLVIGALGVVFGDIGTSPLYALHTVFSIDNGAVRPTESDVYGVVSLMFWSITIVVSIKYVSIVMKADNQGEGGVMALIALIRRLLGEVRSSTRAVVLLGVLGASLFYGDTLITPAISVLSATEGLEVVASSLSHLVLPLTVVILTGLFAVQRWGTSRVGALFGPVMILWFLVLAVSGLHAIIQTPHVFLGLLPTYAVSFVFDHPYIAFVAVGAIVLVITGAEALYADMGHFGRAPIVRAWFIFVLPALTLNYLGQAALILKNPSAVSNPFFLLVPSWSRIPLVILATMATVIASQAVISGAFSVTRQAMQLGFLPPLTVRQTSRHEGGQVYLPAVNAGLFIGVLVLALTFRSSARLATAYGVAVTGALLIDTVLLLVVARAGWRWHPAKIVLAAVVFGGVELAFFSGNLVKVFHGGWLPLLVAGTVFTVMTTWQRGRHIVTSERVVLEGPLQNFVEELRELDLPRVAGTAVFPHPTKDTTPLALRANVRHNGILHEHVIIVSARPATRPVVATDRRLQVDDLGYSDDGIFHLTLHYGFSESPDIVAALRQACQEGLLEVQVNPDTASYFVSRASLRATRRPGMVRWRKLFFITLSHNAINPADYLGLPSERTVVMGTNLDV